MKNIVRQGVVPPHLAGVRVDQAAAELFDEFSRAVLSGWIREGTLTVDGQQVKPKVRVNGGERLLIDATPATQENWHEPQAVDLQVLYEDEHLLVLNKPVGLVVHPGAGHPDGTLVNGLLAYRPTLKAMPRAGIVHRLDKDTSGLMVVAADLAAHKRLVEDLSSHSVRRRYIAVVEGRLVSGRDIDAPIGRHPVHRTRQAVVDDGKPARTQVRVVERYRVHTCIRAELETGRTHQIRVHLAHLGHPLVGDTLYGARRRIPPGANSDLATLLRTFPRQALHAENLAFDHPLSAQAMDFTAPVPDDLFNLQQKLADDEKAHSKLKDNQSGNA